jgi:RNase P protein component
VTGETLQVAKSPPRSHKNALKSAHFVLSALPLTANIPAVKVSSSKKETLFMAIPKRLLKRAVDRNAVKRVCREAWQLKNVGSPEHSLNSQQIPLKPKLIKLISLPSFESTTQLKYLIRTDVDVLFAKLK